MTRYVKIGEVRTHLSTLLADVEAGEDVVISRGATPIARVTSHVDDQDYAALCVALRRERANQRAVTTPELLAWRHEPGSALDRSGRGRRRRVAGVDRSTCGLELRRTALPRERASDGDRKTASRVQARRSRHAGGSRGDGEGRSTRALGCASARHRRSRRGERRDGGSRSGSGAVRGIPDSEVEGAVSWRSSIRTVKPPSWSRR